MKYRKIHYGAWLNKDYGELFYHHFRLQAAIQIQSFFKKKPPILMPVLEPSDKNYLQHIQPIKNGEYTALNFSDPDFVRNIYKALRLNLITKNQSLTAIQVFRAKEWLHDYTHSSKQLSVYSYDDETGPYQLSEINYSTKAQQKTFLRSLENEDKQYITINFPKIIELYLLLDLVLQENILISKKINPTIIKFILIISSQLNLAEFEKKLFTPQRVTELNTHSLKIIRSILEKRLAQKNVLKIIHFMDKQSLKFLSAILELDEKIPSIAISKQHDPNDFYSPILCFVLPTHNALKKLQCAVHENEAIMPYETIGIIDIHTIRHYDEKHQMRPVENVYPGIKYLHRPHGYHCWPFLLTYHDNLHSWRGGANFKRMLRYCRDIFTRKGICQTHDFRMSNYIWNLVDLDYENGSNIRMALKNKQGLIESVTTFFLDILQANDILSFLKREIIITDLFLLFLVDFRRNGDIWNDMISDLFSQEIDSFMKFLFLGKQKSERISHLLKAISIYAPIIHCHANKADEYIILCAKLKNSYSEGAKIFLNAIDKIGIHNVFYWGINSGLFVHEFYRQSLRENLNIHFFKLDDFQENTLEKVLFFVCQQHLSPVDFKQLLSTVPAHYLEKLQIGSAGFRLSAMHFCTQPSSRNEHSCITTEPDPMQKLAT